VPGALGSSSRYTYNYRGTDNSIPNTGIVTTTFTYAAPGSYTILQVGSSSVTSVGTLACRVVEVMPTKEISFVTTTCSNRTVLLTYTLDAETSRYNQVTIDWGDGITTLAYPPPGTTTATPFRHVYAGSATNFTIKVTGSYTGGCSGNTSAQPVTIRNTVASDPTIASLISDATKATITFQGPTGYNMTLYRKSGAGIYEPTSFSGTSGGYFAVPASPFAVSCYQIVATDVCGGSERRSSEVCSLAPVAQSEDKQNTISWPAYTGTGPVRLYRAYKNGFPAWAGPASPYMDNVDITCGKTDCYVIEASVGPTTIRSSTVCTSGKDNGITVSPVSAYVSVQSDGVKVQSILPTVGLPSPYTLIITRSDGAGSAFNPVGESNDRSFVDQTAQTGKQSYCYQTAIRNGCGVLSAPTPPTCTILLTKTSNGSLTWTQASPYSTGPPQSYQIISIDPSTGVSDKKPLNSQTTFQPSPQSQVTQYQIAALNGAGIESYSNPIDVELGLSLFMPNAFAPGSSLEKNRSFMAEGVRAFWNTFEMTIYSRWGDVVFNTTDKDTTGWNGDINGNPAQSGYYSYRIRLTDASGRAFERTGQVLLIR